MNAEEKVGDDETPQTGRHAAAEGAPRHPAIDLSRDPNPGKADHAKPDED
ncbi:hypothetical protein [Amycolatopsis sp. GM8]|nr:hypothetical protein [Amycolatopsis sp. GM8]